MPLIHKKAKLVSQYIQEQASITAKVKVDAIKERHQCISYSPKKQLFRNSRIKRTRLSTNNTCRLPKTNKSKA